MTDFDDGRDSQPSSAVARGDRDRTLEAMHALELAAGNAASGGFDAWTRSVRMALEHLESAFAEQRASYEDPIGLMTEIAQDDPRLRTWVRQLRHRWVELEATTRALRETLESSSDTQAISEVRERVRWLMGAIRHHREREADLVFDALGLDLGRLPRD
jgi:hypothetical protein